MPSVSSRNYFFRRYTHFIFVRKCRFIKSYQFPAFADRSVLTTTVFSAGNTESLTLIGHIITLLCMVTGLYRIINARRIKTCKTFIRIGFNRRLFIRRKNNRRTLTRSAIISRLTLLTRRTNNIYRIESCTRITFLTVFVFVFTFTQIRFRRLRVATLVRFARITLLRQRTALLFPFITT